VARRFQLSVPKRRADDDPWFRIGTLDVTTTVFVIGLNILVMFLYAISNTFFYRLVMVRPLVTNGEVWRLVTWPFATVPNINSAFMLALLWFVGRDLEPQFGRVRFAKFLVSIAATLLVIALVVDVGLGGSRLIVTAVFIAFIAEHPRMPFFFGIPAWILGVVYVGLDVIQYTGDRQPKLVVLLLGGIAAALLLLRGYGWGSEVPWVPRVQIPAILGGPVRPGSARSPKPAKTRPTKTKADKGRRDSGTVVTGPWGERGTGTATGAAADAPRLPRTGPVT
jgi:membrane associated rhomboid family serine protease